MREDEELSALIGAIYDAALLPDTWPDVLVACRKFVGGHAAALYARDFASKSGNVYYDDGIISPKYRQLCFDKYLKIDPSAAGLLTCPVGKPHSTGDLVPYDEFAESRFYKEWARPQGLVDIVGVILDRKATSVAVATVFRHERDGITDAWALRRMGLIGPHIQRAVLIGNVIEFRTVQAASIAAAFDGLTAGVLMVRGDASLVHANSAGRQLLGEASLLRSDHGRLVALDAAANAVLCDVFRRAGTGDVAVGVGGVTVPMAALDGESWVAHVLPLGAGQRQLADRGSAVAAVFVSRAALNAVNAAEAFATAYKLTASELRVLLAIVQVGGMPETAEVLGIAVSTVKTHLLRIYAKTGTSGQADLFKLFAGFASPLAG